MMRYDSYKDSGVEWIGEIPSHWEDPPLRYYFSYTKGSIGQKLTKSYVEDNRGEYPVYSGQTDNDGIMGFVNEYEFDYHFPLIFTTTVGAKYMTTRILQGRFSLSQNCLVMVKKKECVPSFVEYFLKIDFQYRKELIPIIIQPSLRMEDLDRVNIVVPPVTEQHQIVSFLDSKTSLIDSLIEKIQRKIELLKEKRTSLINKVVTKGLNPNVEMKDSGVEWIGEIPSGWEVLKLKYFCDLINEKGTPNNDDIKISPENVESNTGVCFNLYSEYSGEGVKFIEHDILLNKLRLYLKKVLFSEFEGFSMGEMIVLRIRMGVPKFYFRTLFHQGLIDVLDNQSTGVKLPRVSPELIMNTNFPVPPISEQNEIISYLDEQTQMIDKTISIEENRIELLKEYRQSLISEVVTGKIDVRVN